ncbi:hypothetical protein EBB07_13560 [Paenibacillaceae bacterium]|nr:hypothetical protein EBB07_13560 [Paenibacillaceae bacterium]
MHYAFRMAWSELKYKYVSLLMTVLFSCLIGYLCAEAVKAAMLGNLSASDHYKRYFADFLLIAISPSLGALSFSREYMSWTTMADEPFMRRLRFFRMWAIPVNVIAWSRIIYMLICFGAALVSFLAVFVTISWPTLAELWSPAEYASYLLVWIGYAVALNGINPFIEYGSNGKVVFLGTTSMILISFGAIYLLHRLLGKPIYVWVIEIVKVNPFWPAVISIVVGLLGLLFFQRALANKLTKRDLS